MEDKHIHLMDPCMMIIHDNIEFPGRNKKTAVLAGMGSGFMPI